MVTPTSSSTPLTIIFAGSFLQYSAVILEKLLQSPAIKMVGVLTTPPQPSGRSKEVTKTPVHQLAEKNNLPVLTPENLDAETLNQLETTFSRPAMLLTAGYGKLLPSSWLDFPSLAALNLHFSLLPNYRGANPTEWAMLRGETETGVTLIEMTPEFDKGGMVAQATLAIDPSDTRETVYEKLYALGGDVLPEMLRIYHEYKSGNKPTVSSPKITFFWPPVEQGSSPTPYATRLTREAGFISWKAIKETMAGQQADSQELAPQLEKILHSTDQLLDAAFIERAIRALKGFPGVWTIVETAKGPRRLKLLQAHLAHKHLQLDLAQLEGQTATPWSQIKASIL